MFSPKTILVPTDFSKSAEKALATAIDMARQYSSRIYLLHVVGLVIQCTMEYCLDPRTTTLVETKAIDSAKKMIQTLLGKFPDSKSVDIVADIRKGTPYEEIVKAQKEKKADLIVMASRGQSGILRHMVGSVAEKVMRQAKCPLLLLRD
jgi:universal stress protein A